MRRIALLGASGSGKTWLAGQLAQALAAAHKDMHIEEDAALAALPALPALPAKVLLLGLDLHPPTQAQVNTDHALRQALTAAAVPFHVIYGKGPLRLANALQALKLDASASVQGVVADADKSTDKPAKRKPWVWACEKCSDPVCEHRLLSNLLAKR